MPKRSMPIPTKAELAILRVLWENGLCTVREVHEQLNRSQPVVYTTTLRQMQDMFEKGLLERDESKWAHVYSPAAPEEQTLRQVARDLLDRAFGGSAEKLVMHALQDRKLSAEELARIRKLLDELERGRK